LKEKKYQPSKREIEFRKLAKQLHRNPDDEALQRATLKVIQKYELVNSDKLILWYPLLVSSVLSGCYTLLFKHGVAIIIIFLVLIVIFMSFSMVLNLFLIVLFPDFFSGPSIMTYNSLKRTLERTEKTQQESGEQVSMQAEKNKEHEKPN
jgi:hypothetical protein